MKARTVRELDETASATTSPSAQTEEEAPLPRCKHWGFEGACPICAYEERYPELCGLPHGH